jgi:hypothetical protein
LSFERDYRSWDKRIINHKQAEFISDMQSQFNVQKNHFLEAGQDGRIEAFTILTP